MATRTLSDPGFVSTRDGSPWSVRRLALVLAVPLAVFAGLERPIYCEESPGRPAIQLWDFDVASEGWEARKDCTIEPRDGALAVDCTGTEPSLYRQISAAAGLMKLTVRARVKSQHPCRGQVFWLSQNQPRPSVARSTLFTVFRGGQWHDYTLWIRPDEPLDGLWFTPINTPGQVEIDWIRLEYGDFPPPQATPATELSVLPGFRVELLHSVPKEEQGSWVSLTFDPRGRILTADQHGALYRVTLPTADRPIHVERLDVDMGQCQGLLFAYDSLYVTVNGVAAQSFGFYRLRDTTGDDQFDEVELLRRFANRPRDHSDHGPHGIVLGPDGLLYVIGGNGVGAPDVTTASSPHRNWAEDLLLPRHVDPQGHHVRGKAPGGWVFRTDKDGKTWEFVAGGFRNPYDLVFNELGDLFTFDSDMEWDVGVPWYRPTRVNLVAPGAENGWRNGAGKWPAYYADSLPPVVDIGLGCPTGVAVGTGARFPARYQHALFICDWTYGKLYAVHLSAEGSAYSATFETFLSGKPLPLTDLAVGPDGSLYFAIGGRRAQSGLYRVRYVGTESTKTVAATTPPGNTEARALRHRLERLHGRRDEHAVDLAWEHLDGADPFLRSAARIAIEHQDVETWQERAFSESRSTAAIHALLAVARNAEPTLQARIAEKLNDLPLELLTETQTLAALRAYAVTFTRMGAPSAALAGDVAKRLDSLYPSPSDLVNRELCRVLTYLQTPNVVPKTMALLEKAVTPEDQMFFMYVLRNAWRGWTLDLYRKYFSWFQIASTKYKGGHSFQGYVEGIRKNAIANLSDAQKEALTDVLEGTTSHPVVTTEVTRQYVHNWQMADLLPVLKEVEVGRSFARGKAAFEVAKCLACHRVKDEGGATGPDLSTVASRFSARDILESILLPSKTISDQYRPTQFVLAGGDVILGSVESEDEEVVVVRAHPLAPQSRRLKKSEILAREPAHQSLMPSGLVSTLTREELLDLIAFLRAGGNSEDAAFRKQ